MTPTDARLGEILGDHAGRQGAAAGSLRPERIQAGR